MRAMKDSGVKWIGEIPNDWGIRDLKWISHIVMGQSPDSSDVSDSGDLPFMQGNAEFGATYPKAKYFCKNPPKMCSAGDILMSVRAPVGALNYADVSYGIGRGLCAVRPRDVDRGFLWYALQKSASDFLIYSNGSTFDAITVSMLENFAIVVPPLSMQCRIASFLDAKCAQIDAIIEKQQQVIEKLKAYKQSVITEAVTKGLNPTVPMKDSGVEWVGYIPEGWDILPLKKLCHLITDGTHQTPEYLPDGIPFLSIKDISKGYLDFTDTKFISEEKHAELSKHAPIERGDILFTRIGTLGVSVVVDTDVPFDIFVSLGLIKNNKDISDAKWIAYNMTSSHYFHYIQLVKAGGGTSAAKFNLGDVGSSLIILPPLNIQKAIAEYLDQKCAAIDYLINGKTSVVNKLTDYKKSLIYEAVTGKMEV